MHTLLVPVLILATAALSSSNVLPLASMNTEPISFNYQNNDNTYSSKQTRNKLNSILFSVGIDPEINKPPQAYADNNEDFNTNDKNDNYNVKGFRKEQWHNYPRQLDRLNRYFYQHLTADKRNLDPDDPGNVYADESDKDEDNFGITDRYDPEYSELHTTENEAEMAAAVINPLLIFRIHLACYNSNKAIQPTLESIDLGKGRLEMSNKEENSLSNEINPESNQIKVKREGKTNTKDVDTANESSENRTVNKRIFALFSRLQSLNPKGHQLHHRRHMYALYGPPDGEGGGALTAETRATFMRPPGSPLRWG